MNPVLLRLLASLKVAAWAAVGCGGTLTVQRYTTSSSSSWDEKAATEKEGSGKGMKFEINQLSKQLEEKEQSLKTWEEMLAKQAADLKEQQAAVSSAPARMTVATTVADVVKPDQPVVDEASFGEEDPKTEGSKQTKGMQRGIARRKATEDPTSDVPKRPAVFDGGGTPAVAFQPMTDVVTVKEGSDIPEALKAELGRKERKSAVLREQREEARKEKEADLAKYEEELRRLDREKNALEAELEEKDRRLTKLNASNEDLKRELDETKQKLAKADAEAKEKARLWEPESNITLACLRGNEWEDPKKRSEYLKDWLSQKGMLPKDGSFAVCRLKPKEASSSWLWWFCIPAKWAYNAWLDLHRGMLMGGAVRNGKVNLSDVNKYYAFEPVSMYVCATGNPREGMIVKKGKDRYSVRPQSKGWLCWLFCPCKRRTNEIRKLKYEEVAVEVESEENWQHPRIPELSDVLSTEEQRRFEELLPEINGESFVSLDNSEAFKPNKDDEEHGVYASYEELGEPEVGNKYRTIFFVFEPCFLIWDGFKKVKSAFFEK
jgi:hypothetical protein